MTSVLRKNLLFVSGASFFFKLSPLLVGIILLNQIGRSFYGSFSFLIISANLFAAISSTGIGSSLVRKVLKSKSEKQKSYYISRYLNISFKVFFGCTILIILPYILSNSNYNSAILMFFLVLSITFANILIPVMQALGLSKKIFYGSATLFLFCICFALLSKIISYQLFISLYVASYVVFFLYIVTVLYREKLLILRKPTKKNYTLFTRVYKDVFWIFIVNSIWMLALYCFNYYIKHNIPEDYPMFALGYQFLSVIIFLPNAIAPLMLKWFLNDKVSQMKTSFVFLALGLLFCMCLAISIQLFKELFQLRNPHDLNIIQSVALAGCFSAGIAPLYQHLISKNNEYYMLYILILWVVTIIGICIWNPSLFYLAFLASYFFSYVLLLSIVRTKRINK